jgi:Fibronectin type III domain
MSNLTEQQPFLPQTRVANSTCVSLRLTAIITGLLSIMSLLTGCGDGGEPGSNPSPGATVSLKWDPVLGSSVSAYFVYYGKQSPNQSGSCVYERSISVDSPSATVTNLDPDTLYYFAVSAYNGRESPCSEEVSTITPSASA